MTSTTKNTVPQNNSTFASDLDTFLREEDADRFRDMFTGFVVSGGTHVTGAGLVHTPDSLVAYPGGHYITETGSITYPDAATHIWVICHKDTTTAVTNWTRSSGTHYLFRNTGSATKPALPVPESAILMKVTTAAGAVSVVEDHRELEAMARIKGVSPDGDLITDGLFHIASGSAGAITASASELVIENTTNTAFSILNGAASISSIYFADSTNGSQAAKIQYSHAGNGAMLFGTPSGEHFRMTSSGLIVNESGVATLDFRVESDTGTHMLFVDAGNNSVHIDNSLLTGAGDGDLVMANSSFIRFINFAGTNSSNFGISGSISDHINSAVPNTTGVFNYLWAGTTKLLFLQANSGAGIRFVGESMSDHAAPGANNCVIYTTDTGGKTQLMARFATGAVQQIAVEP